MILAALFTALFAFAESLVAVHVFKNRVLIAFICFAAWAGDFMFFYLAWFRSAYWSEYGPTLALLVVALCFFLPFVLMAVLVYILFTGGKQRFPPAAGCGFFAALLLLWPGSCGMNPQPMLHPPSPQLELLGHLRAVGDALKRYSDAHGGHLPPKLSDLVPDYVPDDRVGYFFLSKIDPRYRSMETPDKVNGITEEGVKVMIDEEGAFVYLGDRGRAGGLIAYETIPTRPTARFVLVDTSGLPFVSTWLQETQFQEMLFRVETGQPKPWGDK